MRKRKIPIRRCVACREMVEKKELIRIVRTPEGEVKIDPTGKASGRGAYICSKSACFQKAKSKKVFDRSLKTRVEDHVYDELEKEWLGTS